MTTNVNKTWGDLFDDVYDIDKDGKLNELEGRIFLGTVYRKPLSQIQTSMLSNNILKWNVINMTRSSFIENASKLRNPSTGELQDPSAAYPVFSNLAKQVFKTWAHVFDDIYDIDGDGKLNEYEGKLLLATVYKRQIENIQSSLLNDNVLKWNLVNMTKSSFIENANKLKDPNTGELQSSDLAYPFFLSLQKKYHNPKLQIKMSTTNNIKSMCPIPEPCPVCLDIDRSVDDIDPILTKKLSAPDVIFEKISSFAVNQIINDYFTKMFEYDSKSLEDYVFASKSKDFELLKSITNYLNYSISPVIKDSYSKTYKTMTKDEKKIKINETFKEFGVINPNNKISDILDYYIISISFSPKVVSNNIESFNEMKNLFFYNELNEYIIEDFEQNDIFSKKGYFSIHIIDVLLNDNRQVRKLLFDIDDINRMVADNCLYFNINTISYNNNNLPPNYYDVESMNEFGLATIRRILSKDSSNDFIFYLDENSKELFETAKKDINNLKYEHQKTNILYDMVKDDKFSYIDKLNECINEFKYGRVVDIKEVYEFSVNINKLIIYDVMLNKTKKFYRIINI